MGTQDSGTKKRTSIGARRNPASEQAILDAAEAILKEDGPTGFSIEAVARRARAGKPTIYRWWPSRTVLLLDVYQRFKNARPLPDTGSLRADLEALLADRLIGFWKNDLHANAFRSVIAEAQNDPAAATALAAYETGRRREAAIIVERARQRGELAENIEAELVIDLVAAFAWHRLLTGRLAETPSDIGPVVDMLLEGIKKAPEPA